MEIYSSTIESCYVDRFKSGKRNTDLFFNLLNRGSVRTICAKIGTEIDFVRESRNGKLNVIVYEVRKNETRFMLNRYWIK